MGRHRPPHRRATPRLGAGRTARPLARAIDALAETPRPDGYRKIVGSADLCRIRVGDYRIVYEIQDERLLVLVVKLGHRRDIYRGD